MKSEVEQIVIALHMLQSTIISPKSNLRKQLLINLKIEMIAFTKTLAIYRYLNKGVNSETDIRIPTILTDDSLLGLMICLFPSLSIILEEECL